MTHKKFYVTTPIYYVTARPHLGSLYSTIMADVAARWNKLQGKKAFFLTGTDEHGQKVAQAARRADKEPKEFVDSFIQAYKDVWREYELDYNDFIRTTDERHVHAVQSFIKKLEQKGDIYKGSYDGWYCVHDEAYLTKTDYDDAKQYKKDEGPVCPVCKRPTKWMSEEGYFFRLSAYQDKLLTFYKEHPDFITPRERFTEVINFVKSGLKDLSISRRTITWGIPFPGDKNHVTYVWLDALVNYISAIGYADPAKVKEFDFWWPANLHILGKDIVRPHAIYWPAFLMAAGLPLPRRLLVHGWITVCGKKMSKSLANIVDPEKLYQRFGAEPVRYFLLRQMPTTQDGDFCIEDLEKRISCDLANDLGNLLNRMLTLAIKYDITDIAQQDSWSAHAIKLREESWSMVGDVENYMKDYLFHQALARIWKYISLINSYFHAQEPWKLAKKDKGSFIEVLSATCHSLSQVAYLLWPIMPHKMEDLLNALGLTFDIERYSVENLKLNRWTEHFRLKKISPLFIKPDDSAECKKEQEAKGAQQRLDKKDDVDKADMSGHEISIDEVAQVELLVGTIEQCQEVPKSKKLLKLHVNFGTKGKRIIMAGVKKWYAPEDLVGKQAVFVYNLKPRTMLGMESQGMMLFAESEEGTLSFISPDIKVPNGTRLR